MIKKSIGIAMALLVASVVSAQGASIPEEHAVTLSSSQAKQLARSAHTPAEFTQLASYFEIQRKEYSRKAEEEKQEWERRSQNTSGINQKYPRPVDSARNLFEYYTYKASEAEGLAAKYAMQARETTHSN